MVRVVGFKLRETECPGEVREDEGGDGALGREGRGSAGNGSSGGVGSTDGRRMDDACFEAAGRFEGSSGGITLHPKGMSCDVCNTSDRGDVSLTTTRCRRARRRPRLMKGAFVRGCDCGDKEEGMGADCALGVRWRLLTLTHSSASIDVWASKWVIHATVAPVRSLASEQRVSAHRAFITRCGRARRAAYTWACSSLACAIPCVIFFFCDENKRRENQSEHVNTVDFQIEIGVYRSVRMDVRVFVHIAKQRCDFLRNPNIYLCINEWAVVRYNGVMWSLRKIEVGSANESVQGQMCPHFARAWSHS